MTTIRHPRRPRVAGERQEEIFTACLDLLTEVGYDRLTMDAVAQRAKASKATLYRHWESKAALVVAALEHAKPHAPSPVVTDEPGRTLRDDLLHLIVEKAQLSHDTVAILGAVLPALRSDPDFAVAFRTQFLAPRLQAATGAFQRAIERGEISADVDLGLIAPALAGVLIHRAFVLGEPIDRASIERVLDHLILPAVHHVSCTRTTSAASGNTGMPTHSPLPTPAEGNTAP